MLLKFIAKRVSQIQVSLPNSDIALAKQARTVELAQNICLQNVLCLPDFKCNLILIRKLTQDLNCNITFLPNECYMYDLATKRMIGVGKMQEGLYYFDRDMKNKVHTNNRKTNVDILHWRLGHIPFQGPKTIFDVDFSTENKFDPCDTSPRARQTGNIFSISNNKWKEIFDLVHLDTWGPYGISAHLGASYFLTIVDDWSCSTWVYLIKTI